VNPGVPGGRGPADAALRQRLAAWSAESIPWREVRNL